MRSYIANRRSTVKAAGGRRTPKRWRASGRSPLGGHFEIIGHRYGVDADLVNPFHRRDGRSVLKPCSRTPWILVGLRDQSVLHGVLMHIVQPREIRPLIGQFGLSIIEPHLPVGSAIQTIDPSGRLDMENAEHGLQALSTRLGFGRITHKMIVVGKHSPSFKLPAVVTGHGQEPSMQNAHTLAAPEMVSFLISGGSDEIGAVLGQPMRGSVRPWSLRGRHGENGRGIGVQSQDFCFIEARPAVKAAELRRTPRRWRAPKSGLFFPRFERHGAPSLSSIFP